MNRITLPIATTLALALVLGPVLPLPVASLIASGAGCLLLFVRVWL